MHLPQDFVDMMGRMLSASELERFLSALDEGPLASVRFNPFKRAGSVDCSLSLGDRVEWSSLGFYLKERPNFTLNPLFHAGAFYVQEASSMFLERALSVCGEVGVALDLCAAPGGKSTLLRSLLGDEALLVSNEPLRQRAQVLSENVLKWGHEGSLVTCNFPKDFGGLGEVFDLVVVDAPCSGEGMFRKDNPALGMWCMQNVRECADRQREILSSIWPALKEGGYLIYSTCTYNSSEDEEIVRFLRDVLGAEPVEIPIEDEWGIMGNLLRGDDAPVYHFMPHRTRGEGFFLSLLRKRGTLQPARLKGRERFAPLAKDWARKLVGGDDFVLYERDGIGYALRQEDARMVAHLLSSLYPLHVGLPLYERKGAKLIPHHALAMSRRLREDAFCRVEVGRDEALSYLRRLSVGAQGAERGYVVLSYEGLPLGFVNNLGSRANNMYPQSWRIRH